MTEHVEGEQSKNAKMRQRIDELVDYVREHNEKQREKQGHYDNYEDILNHVFDNLRFNLQYTLGKVEGGDHGSAADIKEGDLEELRQAIEEFKKLLPE